MARKTIGNKNLSQTKKRKISSNPDVNILRKGVFCAQLIEALPKYDKAPCEKVLSGQNNHYIVFGRDRPRKKSSGYGGSGDEQASMLDLCVGRMASDVQQGVEVDNNFSKDAARIYISQKTDIDDNFNLREGKNDDGSILGTPNSVAKSGIGIKADAVRIISREGIKLITRADNKNSAGDSIEGDYYGIDLVAGNFPDGLQPIVKGDNMVECLRRLQKHMEKLDGILKGFMHMQNKLNKAFADHKHISPFFGMLTEISPTAKLVGGQCAAEITQRHLPSLRTHRKNIGSWGDNYLSKKGAGFINSTWNKVN